MTTPAPSLTPAEFESLIHDIRPELHRYATRMTGSIINGEDVVQDALVKAYLSLPALTHNLNLRGWLFRITHNKAIDHLRHYSDEPTELLDEYPTTQETDQPLEEQELAALAPRQRSCVILKEVMGYSLAEISELLNATVPEIKALLHRGRTRLRELATDAELTAPRLDAHEQALLSRYVDRFNARDFDTLRTMLTADVQLNLIDRTSLTGADVIHGNYFNKYNLATDWRFAVGTVDGHLVILGYDLTESDAEPAYYMLLTWEHDHVARIRDYRYARYVMHDATIGVL